MNKIAFFLDAVKEAKGCILKYNVHKASLSIIPQRKRPGIRHITINLNWDLPSSIDKYSFIVTAFTYGHCKYFVLHKPHGIVDYYIESDLYRIKSFFHNDTFNDTLERLVKRAIERDKYINYSLENIDIQYIKSVDSAIQEEIYCLFRYFSDEQLKHISRSMLGTSKKFDSNVVKTQQIIKRIVNYSDQIGEAVELIENFEKRYEDKGDPRIFPRYGKCVNYTDVLRYVEAARKGSEKYYEQLELEEKD